MLSKTSLILRFMVFVFVLGSCSGNAFSEELKKLRVTVAIIRTTYCKADKDLFTVSVKMKVQVRNLSKESVEIEAPLTPWVARVATSTIEADAGHFLFELAGSHYVQKREPSKTVQIDAGGVIDIETGYDFVARFSDSFSYPKSLTAGSTYGIVLVLKPQGGTPLNSGQANIIDSLTTAPFRLDVEKKVQVADCAPAH